MSMLDELKAAISSADKMAKAVYLVCDAEAAADIAPKLKFLAKHGPDLVKLYERAETAKGFDKMARNGGVAVIKLSDVVSLKDRVDELEKQVSTLTAKAQRVRHHLEAAAEVTEDSIHKMWCQGLASRLMPDDKPPAVEETDKNVQMDNEVLQ